MSGHKAFCVSSASHMKEPYANLSSSATVWGILLPVPTTRRTAALYGQMGCGGERHGYSIMRDISTQTKGKLRLGPATLYRSIKHLVEDGLIEESDVRPDRALDDERRHYYRLTELGRQVVVAEVQRLEEALLVARTRPGLRDLLPSPSSEEAC